MLVISVKFAAAIMLIISVKLFAAAIMLVISVKLFAATTHAGQFCEVL